MKARNENLVKMMNTGIGYSLAGIVSGNLFFFERNAMTSSRPSNEKLVASRIATQLGDLLAR